MLSAASRTRIDPTRLVRELKRGRGTSLASMNESAAVLVERAAPIRVRQDNPKKGASALRYAKYMAATTAKEFIDLGGTRADLKHDINKGFVKVLGPTAAPGFAFMRNVPDDILLILLGYCDASSLLALETASRSLLDLLRSPARLKQQEALWCGCLRARWPREGPALCSLGDTERRLGLRPRAPARQIYKAFCTKKVAEPDIQTVALEGDEDALEELAFLVVVGDFAGLCSWTKENADGERADLLRWQPPSSEAHLGVFEYLEDGADGLSTVAELTGDRLHQALHVIDLRSFQCVTLLNTIPDAGMNIVDGWNVPGLQDDDAIFFTSAQKYMMRDHAVDKYPLTRPGGGGNRDAGCSLLPFLALRPTRRHSLPGDADDLPPLRADYRLVFADFVLVPRPPLDWYDEYWQDGARFIHKAEDVCEFVAEVIRQTHSLRR